MITFAESHVDLMGSITFSNAQLTRRWDQELGKKWRPEVQDNLRDFNQLKASLDPETFPSYAYNDALLTEFITDKQTCYTRMMVDLGKNQLLIATLAHEAAVNRKAELELLINGRAAVAEVLDEFDQVVTPAVEAVEPLAATIEGDDNPAYAQAVADLAAADAVIAGASAELIALATSRYF
ncbi:MAG: hypothetical protein Q7L07_03410 [Pseudohongiella sp.]|nr:hypothetical protein [Pseudohongiella sp.]